MTTITAVARRRNYRLLHRSLVLGLAVLGGVVMLVPFAFLVSTALTPFAYVLQIPPQLIPSQPTLDNFATALGANDFALYFLNSAIVAVASTAITVVVAAMLAFTFARYEFPGRSLLFGSLLISMVVPGLVLLIPQFVLAKDLHLINSLLGLVVVYSVMNLGLYVFLLRGFFESIPQDIFDAAAVDGAGVWRTFRSIALPLARPGLAVVTIFSFLGAWDEFTWATTSLSDQSLYTLPMAIRLFQRANGTEWGIVFAASLVALLPEIVVFLGLQRYFISGAFVGATKG
jgi:multiple sugar transport system permease protein